MTTKLPVVRKEQENVGESRQIPTEDDDLEAAIEELGRDYTEEEIRLVRIKFLSEMGN